MTIKPFCQNSFSDSPAIRGSRILGRAFGVPHQFDRADRTVALLADIVFTYVEIPESGASGLAL